MIITHQGETIPPQLEVEFATPPRRSLTHLHISGLTDPQQLRAWPPHGDLGRGLPSHKPTHPLGLPALNTRGGHPASTPTRNTSQACTTHDIMHHSMGYPSQVHGSQQGLPLPVPWRSPRPESPYPTGDSPKAPYPYTGISSMYHTPTRIPPPPPVVGDQFCECLPGDPCTSTPDRSKLSRVASPILPDNEGVPQETTGMHYHINPMHPHLLFGHNPPSNSRSQNLFSLFHLLRFIPLPPSSRRDQRNRGLSPLTPHPGRRKLPKQTRQFRS